MRITERRLRRYERGSTGLPPTRRDPTVHTDRVVHLNGHRIALIEHDEGEVLMFDGYAYATDAVDHTKDTTCYTSEAFAELTGLYPFEFDEYYDRIVGLSRRRGRVR